MQKTLGGDRLGSGKKNKLELHNYGRASFNLKKTFTSTIAPGVLYPSYVNIGINGDTFDIDINQSLRTIPTQGPLFGTFKLQTDFFVVPLRLYQAILHNNPIDIGMSMGDIKLPTMQIAAMERLGVPYHEYNQIATNALIRYLGISGVGKQQTPIEQTQVVTRTFNSTPVLAYYDIFKNYYANKQEENAYVITGESEQTGTATINYIYRSSSPTTLNSAYYKICDTIINSDDHDRYQIMSSYCYEIWGTNLSINNVIIGNNTLADLQRNGSLQIIKKDEKGEYIKFLAIQDYNIIIDTNNVKFVNSNILLQDFPLKNIDRMRQAILANVANETDGYSYDITYFRSGEGEVNKYPYYAVTDGNVYYEHLRNEYIMNGLCLKTYQSDLFNNWIQTEWIDGENGIAAISAVNVTDNKFTIDALNLANKVYNMLNRIAISGGTYQDWQEAVWGEQVVRHCESPMYVGGMSSEVVFDEIVQTAATEINGQPAALGTLGGQGRLAGKRGGKLHIKITEPSIIMGITSITPRICYTQGNKWYMTDLFSVNDLHKPELDGIGFQDLLCEQMYWWDAQHISGGDYSPSKWTRSSAGKIPAWANYQTDINEAYGDFAEQDGKGFMVLSRNYTYNTNDTSTDVTTYIDPEKFNYAFAYSELAAQNFWLEIDYDIVARRKMSAKQIPNL